MRRFLLLSVVFCIGTLALHADPDPRVLIRTLNKTFTQLRDYSAKVHMQFDIPGVNMAPMDGNVYYKQPNHFRIKTRGIFFMPRQNPMARIGAMLKDTTAYTPLFSGTETIQGKKCAVINIIPNNSKDEWVLGKFWIQLEQPCILKTQITTRNYGTIETESFYTGSPGYNLPDQLILRIETRKIRMSRLLAADLNKKSKPKDEKDEAQTGRIILSFSSYKVNAGVSDEVFRETAVHD